MCAKITLFLAYTLLLYICITLNLLYTHLLRKLKDIIGITPVITKLATFTYHKMNSFFILSQKLLIEFMHNGSC